MAVFVEKKPNSVACPGQEKLDPRVRRTRKLLEDSLRALMAERHYNEISVGEITERATVNRATFYAHFDDKRALAASLLRGDLEAALMSSLHREAELNAENLGTFATTVFEFMARILGACPKRSDDFAPSVGPTLQETIQTFLRNWLDLDPSAARAFPGASKDAVATMLGWSLYGAAFRWSHLHHRAPADEAAREIVALLLR